jgi:SAM-dependent methyltransferase
VKIFLAEGRSVKGGKLVYKLNSHWEELGYFDFRDVSARFDLGGVQALAGDYFLLTNAAEVLTGRAGRTASISVSVEEGSLVVGHPLSGGITVTGGEALALSDDAVQAFVPLPFRDRSFNRIYVVNVTSRDVINEACRLLKPGGVVTLILPDPSIGGVNPEDGVKLLSVKFDVARVKFKGRFWIFEGKMRRLCGTER